MVKVHTIYTKNSLRNFTYLISDQNSKFWCVDPWDAKEITSYIRLKKGELVAIINTHEHDDHTKGNDELKGFWGATIYGLSGIEKYVNVDEVLREGDTLSLSKSESTFLQVLDTPGHTMSHLCLLLKMNNNSLGLFSGDTLFNAGVGNCHNGGDPEVLYQKINNKILSLNENMIIYPGHDYLENNLEFTLKYDSNNTVALELLEQVKSVNFDNEKFQTTLGVEKEINLFLQTKNKEEFIKLRELRNIW